MGKFWWMLDLLAEVDTILINAVDHLADCGSSKPDQLSANHEILDDNFLTIPCGALWRCLVDWSRPRCLADQPLGLSELGCVWNMRSSLPYSIVGTVYFFC